MYSDEKIYKEERIKEKSKCKSGYEMIKSFGIKKRDSRIFIYTLVVLLLLLQNDLLPRPHLGWAKFLCGTEKYKKTKRTFRLFYASLTKTIQKKKK